MTIWKYPLLLADLQTVQMPAGAKPLCVQVQDSGPCLWALVNEHEETQVDFEVRTVGTGHPLTTGEALAKYVGTYQLDGGRLVFHVFVRL